MENVITDVSVDEIERFLTTSGLAAQLSESERAQFVETARQFGLNPFKREIYCTVYGEGKYRKFSIVTGYGVYIKRAERTGKLDGWNVRMSADGKVATITIHRKDWSHPFEHEVYYEEAVQKAYGKDGSQRPNAVWQKMPRFMLKKVAIGQGFRLCFADEFGGMPYEESEMPQGDAPKPELRPADAPADGAGRTDGLSRDAAAEKARADVSAARLREILAAHSEHLTADTVKNGVDALDWTDADACDAMAERVKTYLRKRGVEV